jgi:hypothetical protein
VRPSYGGGRYYGGGASVPYRSGARSPGGIAPVFLGVGLLAFWPGLWLYGAHLYYHPHPYNYYNQTSQQNETKPVICGCDPYEECGCDTNSDSQFMTDLIGNGSYNALNHTLVTVADVNGTSTILINGTLPNGTVEAMEEGSGAAGGLQTLLQNVGWWPVVATVGAIIFAA